MLCPDSPDNSLLYQSISLYTYIILTIIIVLPLISEPFAEVMILYP